MLFLYAVYIFRALDFLPSGHVFELWSSVCVAVLSGYGSAQQGTHAQHFTLRAAHMLSLLASAHACLGGPAACLAGISTTRSHRHHHPPRAVDTVMGQPARTRWCRPDRRCVAPGACPGPAPHLDCAPRTRESHEKGAERALARSFRSLLMARGALPLPMVHCDRNPVSVLAGMRFF